MLLVDPRDKHIPGYAEMGGKARELCRLSRNFPVPRFLVVMDVDVADDPGRFANAIDKTLGGGPYAVRSSASGEDGRLASFAGIFLTRLGVGSLHLGEAIREVISSEDSQRVREYGAARDIDVRGMRMSVVVQCMVSARRAGVALSRYSNKNDDLMIEAVLGLGELLVGGEVEPDRYLVSRRNLTVVERKGGFQSTMMVVDERGEAVRRPVPSTDRRAPKLTTSQTRDVARLAIAVESESDWPAVDMEWAIESNTLWLLQARPFAGYGEA